MAKLTRLGDLERAVMDPFVVQTRTPNSSSGPRSVVGATRPRLHDCDDRAAAIG